MLSHGGAKDPGRKVVELAHAARAEVVPQLLEEVVVGPFPALHAWISRLASMHGARSQLRDVCNIVCVRSALS